MPVLPRSEMLRTPSARTANALGLDLRPQGRFEAPLHTGDCRPERAMRECPSTRVSSTIGRLIDVRGSGRGPKCLISGAMLALGVRCSTDRGQGRAVFSPLAYITEPCSRVFIDWAWRDGVEGPERPTMTTHGGNGIGGQTTRAILCRQGLCNVTSDAFDEAGPRIRRHFVECECGCGGK
jgi:hypothetical protein